jgi:hypothetical protein|tara:strand:+ start:334 stop:471 length:138 start_codon:yes stop_codon:yes gene_type:complete
MNLLGIMAAKLFDSLFRLIGTKPKSIYSQTIIPKHLMANYGRTGA